MEFFGLGGDSRKWSAAMAMRKLSGLALAAVLGTGLASGQASAMPANGLASAATQAAPTNGVQNVRYVCGPYRCWWTPGRYYYGPRYYNYYVGPHHWWWRRHNW
jgi:hypothetical protein